MEELVVCDISIEVTDVYLGNEWFWKKLGFVTEKSGWLSSTFWPGATACFDSDFDPPPYIPQLSLYVFRVPGINFPL